MSSPNIFATSGNPRCVEDRLTHALIATLAQADRRVLGAFLSLVVGKPAQLAADEDVTFSFQVPFERSRPDAMIEMADWRVVIEVKRFQSLSEPQLREHHANVVRDPKRTVLLALTNAHRTPALVTHLQAQSPTHITVRHVGWSEVVALCERLAPSFSSGSATRLLLEQLNGLLRSHGYLRPDERSRPTRVPASVAGTPIGELVRYQALLEDVLRPRANGWLHTHGRPDLADALRYRARFKAGTRSVEFEQLETKAIRKNVASVRLARVALDDPGGPVRVTMSLTHSVNRPDSTDVLGRYLPALMTHLTPSGVDLLELDPPSKPAWRAARLDYGEFEPADLRSEELVESLAEELARLIVAWDALRGAAPVALN